MPRFALGTCRALLLLAIPVAGCARPKDEPYAAVGTLPPVSQSPTEGEPPKQVVAAVPIVEPVAAEAKPPGKPLPGWIDAPGEKTAVAPDKPADTAPAPLPQEPTPKSQTESPKAEPEPKAEKRPDTEEYQDLAAVLANAGFEAKRDWGRHLASYVRFGTKALADKYLEGDRFDKIEVEKRTKDRSEGVFKVRFRMTSLAYRPVVREDIETEGLLAEVALPMRVRGAKPFHADAAAFNGVLAGMNPSEIDARRYSFLTKDGQLRVCTPAEAAVVKRNDGVLYHPEVANTTLILVLKGKLDDLKDMARNQGGYSVEIDFTELRYSRPQAWGCFRKDAYLDARGDCERVFADFLKDEDAPQPVYFATAIEGDRESKIPEIVQARLKALRVVGKGGKILGTYLPK